MLKRKLGDRFINLVHSFIAGESGMTVPLLAVTLLTITGFTGLAVDLGRLQLVQARLTSALDAAGLAAGSSLNTSDYHAEVIKYLNLNFPIGYMGATAPSASVVLSNNNMVINLSASTTMPTTFMHIFGISTLTVEAASQITRSSSGLEVVMVLDNTYSMSLSGKMAALKAAASSMVTILTGGQETVRDLWMGLVPFNQTVNIGKAHTNWTTSNINPPYWASSTTSVSGQAATDWGGCVDARYNNGRDLTDDPPSVEQFIKYYFPSTLPTKKDWWGNLIACSGGYNTWVKTWSGSVPTAFCSGIGVNTNGLGAGMLLGPNTGCPQAVTPMTASATTVRDAVDDMTPVGYTHVGLGLVWGWRMLSPQWRGLWGDEMDANNLPLNYHTLHMNKAIILLTDGENTMTSTNRTAYGYLSEGHLGSTWNTTVAEATLDSKMMAVCNAVKSHGIYLYTIALGNPGENIQNLMRDCATAESYFYNSPTADELQRVFSAIGDSLSNLRVSK